MSGLLRAALLGADQVPPGEIRAGLPLDDLIAGVAADPGWRLLLAAATQGVARAAAERASELQGLRPLEPCPEDPRPTCSPAAAGILQLCIREHAALLPEALELLEARALLPPPELLPALLRIRDDELQAALGALRWPRATWLAALMGLRPREPRPEPAVPPLSEVIAGLAGPPGEPSRAQVAALLALPRPWPPRLTAAWLHAFHAAAQAAAQGAPISAKAWAQAAARAAVALPASAFEAARAFRRLTFPRHYRGRQWTKITGSFMRDLELRRRLRTTLGGPR